MERIDDLQVNGLRLIQDTEMFCFGSDAVELASFAGQNRAKRACDLGAGSGIIPVLLAGKYGINTVGVEIQQSVAALAKRNIELNKLEMKAEIVCARMQDYAEQSENVGAFDLVTCNPPYRKAGSGMKQESECVAIARHEIAVTLAEVIHCAARLLGTGGKFCIICQTERLAELMHLCTCEKLEPKLLHLLETSTKRPSQLFLLQCIKDASIGLKLV